MLWKICVPTNVRHKRAKVVGSSKAPAYIKTHLNRKHTSGLWFILLPIERDINRNWQNQHMVPPPWQSTNNCKDCLLVGKLQRPSVPAQCEFVVKWCKVFLTHFDTDPFNENDVHLSCLFMSLVATHSVLQCWCYSIHWTVLNECS